jgi:hypothetical protein
MKNIIVRVIAVALVVLPGAVYAEGPIVISDGPESTGQTNSKYPTIITTDGPSHPAYSYPPPIVVTDGPSQLPYQSLSGVVTSDGPSTPPLAAKPIVTSDGPGVPVEVQKPKETNTVPDPEVSTLAPAATVVPSEQAIPKTTLEKDIPIGTWKSPAGKDFFYVYSDQRKSGNHFIPSGWMGDFNDIHFNDASTVSPHSGNTCIKIAYSPQSSQGSGWAGMYWQTPANNWGDKAGGYDLRGRRRLTFWARGAKGGEVISEFKMGGIGGEKGDSDSASTGSIVLTKQWQKYTIGLADKDLSHIIGGFCWSAKRDSNPNGMTFYLDDIRYE